MNIHKIFKSTFFKYLLSYVIVLMIPAFTVGLIFYNSSYNTLQNELMNKHISMLTQVKNIIDENIVKMINIACRIEENMDLRPYYVFQKIYNGLIAKDELAKHNSADSMVSEIVIFYRDKNIMYSNNSSYTVSKFIKEAYYQKDKQEYNDFFMRQNSFFIPAEEIFRNVAHNDRIIYAVPIPNRYVNPYAVVMFVIEKNKIIKMFEDIVDASGAYTAVVDGAGNVVASTVSAHKIEDYKNISSLLGNNDTGKINISGKEYLVSKVKSDRSDWIYITLADRDKVMEGLNKVRELAIYSFIIVLLAGSFVISLVMHLNYNPLKKLMGFIENITGGGIDKSNSIDAIRQAIENISESTNELKLNKLALKEYLLLQLIKGNIKSVEEFNSKGAIVGLVFKKSFYSVATIKTIRKQAADPSKNLSILNDIESLLIGEITGYARESTHSDEVIMIMSMDNQDLACLEKKLNEVKEYLKNQHNTIVTIGVGNIYSSVSQMGKSYIESYTALDYRFIRGSDSIIFFSKMFSPEIEAVNTWITQDIADEISLFIKRGDSHSLCKVIMQIADNIKREKVSLSLARCICYDLVNTIIRTTFEMGIAIDRINLVDVFDITDFETLEELVNRIKMIANSICDGMKMKKESHNFDLVQNIIEYINENITDYNFSVNTMAQELSLSPSYLSRYFKDQTGSTIMDYFNNERVKIARKLLAEDNASIDEIAEKVGYCSASGFIRMFKRVEGITPGEYRKTIEKANNLKM